MKQRNHIKRRINNEKGVALVAVLMVLVVLSILGVSLLGLAATNMKQSSIDRDYQATYYIAEAGSTYMMDQISQNVTEVYPQSASGQSFFAQVEQTFPMQTPTIYHSFEETFNNKPEAKIRVEKVSSTPKNAEIETRTYKLISEGIIGGHSRTVERLFYVNWKPQNSGGSIPDDILNNLAVFSKTTIHLTEGAKIDGNVGTTLSAPNAITLNGGAKIVGNKNYSLNHTLTMPPFPSFPVNLPYPSNNKIEKDQWNHYDVVLDGNVRIDNWMANGYTLKLTEDMAINEIKITENNVLNIDVGNSDRRIVVKNLTIPNGHIKLNGTGKLTIYVTGNIVMDSGSTINNNGDIKKLELYLKGSGKPSSPKSVTLTGSQKIFGSLYAEDATISFGNGSGFEGHIITGGNKFTISGGVYVHSRLIYAPNANVSLIGGGSVKGSIIANSYYGDGGTLVTYEKNSDLPFFPEENVNNDIPLLTPGPIKEIN